MSIEFILFLNMKLLNISNEILEHILFYLAYVVSVVSLWSLDCYVYPAFSLYFNFFPFMLSDLSSKFLRWLKTSLNRVVNE